MWNIKLVCRILKIHNGMVCDSHVKSKTRAEEMFGISHSKNDLRDCVLRV